MSLPSSGSMGKPSEKNSKKQAASTGLHGVVSRKAELLTTPDKSKIHLFPRYAVAPQFTVPSIETRANTGGGDVVHRGNSSRANESSAPSSYLYLTCVDSVPAEYCLHHLHRQTRLPLPFHDGS
jgi:hypothetical protein